MRKHVSLFLVLSVVVSFPSLSVAGLKSFKGPLVRDKQTPVSVANSGIRVLDYRFHRSVRGTAKLFRAGSGPVMHLTVTNEGAEPTDFAVAIALFDKSGNLVGVATENPNGKLDPGETEEMSLTFRHLNRFAKQATSLQMSIETHL